MLRLGPQIRSKESMQIPTVPQWHYGLKSDFLHSENEAGSWNVSERNVTCILLRGNVQLTINYTDTSNTTKLSSIDVPPSALAKGSCTEPNEQYIILSWQPTFNSSQAHSLNNTLTFVFRANETSRKFTDDRGVIPVGKFAIVKVAVVIHKNEQTFPNATNPGDPIMIDQQGLAVFPTTLKHSFACDAVISIGSSNDKLAVLLEDSQIESFRVLPKGHKEDGDFSPAEHCSADEISTGHLVIIVILCVVVLVLIAIAIAAVYHMEYVTKWLGKRRASTETGYQNM